MNTFLNVLSTELPKLRIPPIVKDNECGNVTISWNGWSTAEDVGKGPIVKYKYVVL